MANPKDLRRVYANPPQLPTTNLQLPTTPLAVGDWDGLRRLLEAIRQAINSQDGVSERLTIFGTTLGIIHGRVISSDQESLDNVLLVGNAAAFQVINAALTQNWYFGIDASDGNKLKIGRGSSPAQGITPSITITPGSGIIAIGDPTNVTAAMLTITSNDTYGQDDCMFWLRRYGTGTSESLMVHEHINSTGVPQPIIAGRSSRGTFASPAALHAGDHLLILDGRGQDGSSNDYGQGTLGVTDSECTIFLRTAELWTGTAHGTQMEFFTTKKTTASPRRVFFLGDDGSMVSGTAAGSFQDGLTVIPSGTSGIGQVLVPDSSSEGTGLGFTLDPDTGFIRAATNAVGIVCGGAEKARVDATGCLSIGSGANGATSAIVDVTSTTRGVLDPRMTSTQRDAITSPGEGLWIYNLTTHHPNYWNGSAWVQI